MENCPSEMNAIKCTQVKLCTKHSLMIFEHLLCYVFFRTVAGTKVRRKMSPMSLVESFYGTGKQDKGRNKCNKSDSTEAVKSFFV